MLDFPEGEDPEEEDPEEEGEVPLDLLDLLDFREEEDPEEEGEDPLDLLDFLEEELFPLKFLSMRSLFFLLSSTLAS